MSERLVVTADDIAEQPAVLPRLTIGQDDLQDETPQRPSGPSVTLSDSDLETLASEVAIPELEQAMFRLVVAARRRYIPSWMPHKALRWHPGAAIVSRQHAAAMLARHRPGQTPPEGLPLSQRLDRAGITFLACGENVGLISGPASHGEQGIVEVQNAFMNQPRSITNHRGNILNPIWTHAGIGIAYTPEGQLVVAQTFMITLNSG